MFARVRVCVLAAGFSVGIFCQKDQHDSQKTNMSLTDTKVRSLKVQKAQYKVTDGEGLHLLITPSGGKLWRLASLPKFPCLRRAPEP